MRTTPQIVNEYSSGLHYVVITIICLGVMYDCQWDINCLFDLGFFFFFFMGVSVYPYLFPSIFTSLSFHPHLFFRFHHHHHHHHHHILSSLGSWGDVRWRVDMTSDNYWRRGWSVKEGRNVLFNDALNTFYSRSYGVGQMVKDHSVREETRLHDSTYHSLCYTSRGAVRNMRNSMRKSSMGPPWRIDPTTHRTMSGRSYHGATSFPWVEVTVSVRQFLTRPNSHMFTPHWNQSTKVLN